MSNSEDCCVVGSGPAGISCVQALLAAGRRVTILGPGLQLEPARERARTTLAASDPSHWASGSAFLKEGVSGSASGIPLKLAYGSDFPYRQVPGATSIACDGPDTRPSYAAGGLSTVWGGAVLPFRQTDIAGWPVSLKDLEPGYRAVLEWMPLAASEDALSDFFPLYNDRVPPRKDRGAALPMSRQARSLLANLDTKRAPLNASGFYFGASRLAVDATKPQSPCVRCGLCMYGCPHGLIYSSEQTLAALLATGRVRYKPGVTVRSVHESENGVLVRGVGREGAPAEFRAERVFIGAGALNTTAILLRSLQQYDMPVKLCDSQYFLLPLLRFRGTANVVREGLHTLAQLFIEIFDAAISPYTIHLQTYTYNELFRETVSARLGHLKRAFPMEALLGRLLLFQGYLHSAHSASISATLRRDANGSDPNGDTLQLRSVPNAETAPCIARLTGKLARLARHTGLLPLRALLQMGKPGRGFHSGGSFPMSLHPGAQETDILGRPTGFRRVHAIDSAVLPSIPATTITFTAMANAYRIGQLSALSPDPAA
jgi:choline dehydrogenase-like flavoprotein